MSNKKRRTSDDSSEYRDHGYDNDSSSASSEHPEDPCTSAKEFILGILGDERVSQQVLDQNWQKLGPHWKSDADVAMAAIKRKLSTDLRELPESLQHNRKFVLQAVKENPDLWRSLPADFKNDFAFVRAISKFKRKRSSDLRELPESSQHNREFVLQAVKWNPDLWRTLPAEFKNDFTFVRAIPKFKRKRSSDLRELPESLRHNREFVLQAVKGNPDLWRTLPADFKNDFAFVRVIPKFKRKLVSAVFAHFPDKRNDRELWSKVIDSAKTRQKAEGVFERHASETVRADQVIMTRAYDRFTDLLHYADPSLFENRDFAEHVLVGDKKWQDWDEPYRYIPHDAQLRWIDLVSQAFAKRIAEFNIFRLERWASQLAPKLRNDRNAMKAWFQAGGPFFSRLFPSAWKKDKEIFLWIAKYCSSHHVVSSFEQASRKLKKSKSFMLQAIEHNAKLFRLASEVLRKDFAVVVTALASSASFREGGSMARNFFDYRKDDVRLVNFLRDGVEERLGCHGTFMGLILPAMRFGGTDSTALAWLDQGSDTAKSYTMRIADFVGVPYGKELRRLRRAQQNIPDPDEFRLLSPSLRHLLPV